MHYPEACRLGLRGIWKQVQCGRTMMIHLSGGLLFDKVTRSRLTSTTYQCLITANILFQMTSLLVIVRIIISSCEKNSLLVRVWFPFIINNCSGQISTRVRWSYFQEMEVFRSFFHLILSTAISNFTMVTCRICGFKKNYNLTSSMTVQILASSEFVDCFNIHSICFM